jgi:methylglutaconyl-CoA hydratase
MFDSLMTERVVEVKKDDSVAWIYINRPTRHNAFNLDTIEAILKEIAVLENDPLIRAIVITGKGPSFCSGSDVEWMQASIDYPIQQNIYEATRMAILFRGITDSTVTTIACVNGQAFGGGVGLLAACDYVVASNEVIIGLTEVRLGLIPSVISPHVIRRIGSANSKELFLTGVKINAEEACRIGLISEIIPLCELEQFTAKKAALFAKREHVDVAKIKKFTKSPRTISLDVAKARIEAIIAKMNRIQQNRATVPLARSYNSFRELNVAIKNGIAWLRLTTSSVLTAQCAIVLKSVIEELDQDSSVRVIIICGAENEFAVGAADSSVEVISLLQSVAETCTPTIARTHGLVGDDGVGLLAACDIAITSSESRFHLPKVQNNRVPAASIPYIIEKIGHRADDFVLTGSSIRATRAYEIGLVNKVVPYSELDHSVEIMAADICLGGPCALAIAKDLISVIPGIASPEVDDLTARLIAEIRVLPEAQEGMEAFLSKPKRHPKWVI